MSRSRRLRAGRAHAAERTSGCLGAGRLRTVACQRLMSAYLKRYPEVCGELRLSDRMVTLVETGSTSRCGSAISPIPAGGAQRRRYAAIVVAHRAIWRRRGEPMSQGSVAAHHTMSSVTRVRRNGASWRTAASSRGRMSPASPPTAPMRPSMQSRRRPDPGAGLSGGDAEGGRLKVVLANSSRRRCRSIWSIRRRGCCRQRCGVHRPPRPKFRKWDFGASDSRR